jgi:hypothetical protein
VAGYCEHGDEISGSGGTELVGYLEVRECIKLFALVIKFLW